MTINFRRYQGDPVARFLQEGWSQSQKDDPSDTLLKLFTRDRAKFYKVWSGYLTKGLMDYAKAHSRTWYSLKLSPNFHTPFKVRYNPKENSIYVYGEPPNANISKIMAQKTTNRSVPWGKTEAQSENPHYRWHGAHYHRVFIPFSDIEKGKRGWIGATRKASSKGIWYTAKTKAPENKFWFTKKSHMKIEDAGNGHYRRVSSTYTRSYPYPAAWVEDGYNMHNAWFDRGHVSVSDHIMKDERFYDILWGAFEMTKERF